jgi:hypothetical protein
VGIITAAYVRMALFLKFLGVEDLPRPGNPLARRLALVMLREAAVRNSGPASLAPKGSMSLGTTFATGYAKT